MKMFRFEPNASWSLPEQLFMVSERSAKCTTPGDPMSCQNALQNLDQLRPARRFGFGGSQKRPDYAWTDLTYLLHKANVSWAYYVAEGTQPDCEDDAMFCQPQPPAWQHPDTLALLRCCQEWHIAIRLLGCAQRSD